MFKSNKINTNQAMSMDRKENETNWIQIEQIQYKLSNFKG